MPNFSSKTNWSYSDFYNVEDWTRLCNNVDTIVSKLKREGFSDLKIHNLELDRGVYSLPYVSLVNRLERNLEKIKTTLGAAELESSTFKTWYATTSSYYTENPSADDWNRWESFLLKAYGIATKLSRAEYVCAEFCSGEV